MTYCPHCGKCPTCGQTSPPLQGVTWGGQYYKYTGGLTGTVNYESGPGTASNNSVIYPDNDDMYNRPA